VLPRFRSGAFVLFAVVFTMTLLVGDRPIADRLLLAPGSVLVGEGVYQPLSALFLFPEPLVLAVLSTFVVQWTLGSELEGFWGTRRYLLFSLVSGLAGTLGTLLVAAFVPAVASARIGGATAFDLAACLGFAVVFGQRSFIPLRTTEVSGRTIGLVAGLLVIALPILALVTDPNGSLTSVWPQFVPPAFAAACALVFVSQPWRRRSDSGKVDRQPRDRSHLRVVRNADDMLN
jgi:hypothetical protein